MAVLEEDLIHALRGFLGSPVEAGEELAGGYEARVIRCTSDQGDMVVHVSPEWRTRQELQWVHDLTAHVRGHVEEAIPPIRGTGGSILEWRGRCVAVYPFVEGGAPAREDREAGLQAAALLARVHSALALWSGAPRPQPGPKGAHPGSDSEALDDPELDRWRASLREEDVAVGPTHGDFYPGNLLCREARIRGVIDWHEADVRPIALELAGAAFEFCRDREHVLDRDRATEFVEAYMAASGPLPEQELRVLAQWIRWWVREDARQALAHQGEGDGEYALLQVKAFRALAGFTLEL